MVTPFFECIAPYIFMHYLRADYIFCFMPMLSSIEFAYDLLRLYFLVNRLTDCTETIVILLFMLLYYLIKKSFHQSTYQYHSLRMLLLFHQVLLGSEINYD